ncbi:hypothetical protein AQI88_28205 [Streptomyces cellostaticus]|uniref:DUF1648 domain-containing protein n=1 Tax=Streptomyces cellostaticus TaxID=67285 RepID=A0A101NGT4_9ACTN|nr:hypothetical protein [Streptomyces cellostaticus]KUM93013.1 hypothetical protein AQI88_28205 [Streptomyces cellostaticus]GHI06030.1 hypothetical protein Scel_43510 [Streptomyces cellostaticus]
MKDDGTTAERGPAGAFAAGTGAAAALIAGLPWAASGHLPARLATHWNGGHLSADGSMPLWAASLFPALIWLAAAGTVAVVLHCNGATRRWRTITLLPTAVLLCGAQASIIRANFDHTDWHAAQLPTGWLIATLATAVLTAAGAWLASTRRSHTP